MYKKNIILDLFMGKVLEHIFNQAYLVKFIMDQFQIQHFFHT